LRIGLNGTAFDALSSGARERFLMLHGAAARGAAGHEFFLYSPRDVPLGPLFPGTLAGSARSPLSPDRPLRRFLRSGRWFRRRAAADGLDLFVTDHFPVLPDAVCPTLLTIHDLRYLVLPDAGSPLRRAYFRRRYAEVARRARVVVTVSETIRQEVLARLGVPADRVRVVPNGVREDFRRTTAECAAALRARVGLPPEYLLTVGVLERRKNLSLLLEAYAAAGSGLPPLVVSGRGGPEEPALRAAAARLGVGERVVFAGYVPEEDLPALYTGARALLMPSRYEGFGLPVVQAFACGTPVACANASALPEVAGGAALLLDPRDVDAWRAAFHPLVEDTDLRSRLREDGLRRAAVLTWGAAAARLLDLLRELDA